MLKRKKEKMKNTKESNCKKQTMYIHYIICALIFAFYGYVIEIRIGN